VLGYKNEYDIYPDTPLLKVAQGKTELLVYNDDGFKDIGRNGTYFCFAPSWSKMSTAIGVLLKNKQ
jgi:hypothetical protein